MARVDSYDRSAPTPAAGRRWVWEIGAPHARALVEVIEAQWNGEECWVRTRTLLQSDAFPPAERDAWNDLSRFAEAVTPVGNASLTSQNTAASIQKRQVRGGNGEHDGV